MDESFVIVEGNSPSLLLLSVAHGPIHHFRVSFLSSPLMIPLASLLKQPCEQAHIVEKAANSAAFL